MEQRDSQLSVCVITIHGHDFCVLRWCLLSTLRSQIKLFGYRYTTELQAATYVVGVHIHHQNVAEIYSHQAAHT